MKKKLKFFIETILNSYSKVFFAENKTLGTILLIVSFFDYWCGLMGILSVFTVLVFSKLLKFNIFQVKNGSLGFNSLLVGLGIGLYFKPHIYVVFITIIFSLLTLLITFLFESILNKYRLPFLSLPFLLTMWIVNLSVFPLENLGISQRWIYVYNEIFKLGGFALVKLYDKLNFLQIPLFWRTYFLSLGAIFFQMSVLAGIFIAIGLLIYSRIVFLLSLIGFALAFYSFKIFHIDINQLSYTYIGFNFILTAIAVGGYYVIPSKSSFLSLLVLMPITVFVSLAGIKIFSYYNLPLYSLPFNVVVLLYLLALRFRQDYQSAGLIEPIFPKATPEFTLYDFQNNLDRFYSLNYLPVFLPVQGFWFVSQGHNGTYTHKGDWKHAWDFVIVDNIKNQFKGSGDFLEDYYCYSKPVVAPADGTVVKVIDSVQDNKIGDVNIKENWGNVIVIKHSEYLYSLLAHLKLGSIKVKVGQFVKRGQVLAQVGNSGRSPYPHLHFQLQATPYIGSPTLDYPLAYYILKKDNSFELKKFQKPKENQIVANVIPLDFLVNIFDFEPGRKLEVKVNDKNTYIWQIQTTPDNFPFIYCPSSDSYAFFKNDGTSFYMTDFKGKKQSPLFFFYLSVYKIILAFYQNLTIQEPLPIYFINRSKSLLILQDFLAPFYLFIKAEYKLNYVKQSLDFTDEYVQLHSEVYQKFFGKKIKVLEAKIFIYPTKIQIFISAKNQNLKLEIQ